MTDGETLASINRLVTEEHELMRAAEHEHGLTEAQRERLRSVQVQLDQCWDLLRQRRARREFGEDPEGAQVRDPNIVENYKA